MLCCVLNYTRDSSLDHVQNNMVISLHILILHYDYLMTTKQAGGQLFCFAFKGNAAVWC
uniref:Uncharacterized protein n=1 Tax=Arundo donax TaxID=35708 RepID=A0A0A9BDS4_ARUDO